MALRLLTSYYTTIGFVEDKTNASVQEISGIFDVYLDFCHISQTSNRKPIELTV